MIQKATAMSNWWLAASSQQHIHSWIASRAVFLRNIRSSRWPPPQPRFSALQLLAFPKTKITFEREKISDRQWDSGKYDGAADGDWEIVWGPKVPTLKGTEASLSYIQCYLYLVSSSVNVSISWYVAGYFPDRLHYLYKYTYVSSCLENIKLICHWDI